MARFFVNTKAVLFHDYLDKRNSYHTIVCNSKTQTYLKVNPYGYKILQTIDENPGITLDEISKKAEVEEGAVEKFISTMASQNVVFVE